MLQVLNRTQMVGRQAIIAYRTTHIDKAGKTSAIRFVKAEIVELDASSAALLVSDDGVHLRFPSAMLYPGGTRAEFIGGQEIIRDFHNAIEPVSLRWLDERELQNELTAAEDSDL